VLFRISLVFVMFVYVASTWELTKPFTYLFTYLVCVRVEGPNTMCRCNIERLQDGRRKVTYVPVEVGTFTITITWNGREIPGIN